VQELQRQVAELQSHTGNSAPADADKALSKETTSRSPRKVALASTTATSKQSGSDKADTHSNADVSKQPVDSSTVKKESSAALLAQQLPPLPKYNGNCDDESFQEWIAQFELVAKVCKWTLKLS
jgi:hypothetical protein